MEERMSHERILIAVALILFACIIGYNAFFVPKLSVPTVVYVDNDSSSNSDSDNIDNYDDNSQSDENSVSVDNTVGDKININTASADKLCELPRIGPALASRIIDYRENTGKFNSIEDLMNVSGIGEKIFANIESMICV